MFTPEFSSLEKGEFVLIANHALGSPEQVALSVAYNKARAAYGLENAPEAMRKCRIVYDIRGQLIPEPALATVREQLRDVAVEFIR